RSCDGGGGAAFATPAGGFAAWLAGCLERGRTGGRAIESPRPILLRSAAVRLHRAKRPDARALVLAGTVLTSMRGDCGDAARDAVGRVARARAVRRNGVVARHDDVPQHCRLSKRREQAWGEIPFR